MYAIQTKFNAHRYRSRLEARYAVLLQCVGLPFHEGFELESGRYLPDFWLPTKGIWPEVKGWVATSKDQCQCLADDTDRRVVMAFGDPSSGMQWVAPDIVLDAIEIAQSARFEFGETPNVVDFTHGQHRKVG
jgi:hypothetical protein